jgi:hypothetical protein
MSVGRRNEATSSSSRSILGLFELLLAFSLFALELQLMLTRVLLQLGLAPHAPLKSAGTALQFYFSHPAQYRTISQGPFLGNRPAFCTNQFRLILSHPLAIAVATATLTSPRPNVLKPFATRRPDWRLRSLSHYSSSVKGVITATSGRFAAC